MKDCRICGQTKSDEKFYKVKHFYLYHDKNVIWCRECQKMYIEMKRREKKAAELSEKKLNPVVEFL